MANELVCPTHGPYDISFGNCPFCERSSKRPQAPKPLSDDDITTDLDNGAPPMRAWDDEAPTDLATAQREASRFAEIDEDPTVLGAVSHRSDQTELDEEETGLLGILWVMEGQRRGRIYKISEGLIFGRNEGDLILFDPKVSSPHAKIMVENDQFVLWDFASRNGTYVNGEKIRAATPLNENDTIKIGDTLFILKIMPSE